MPCVIINKQKVVYRFWYHYVFDGHNEVVYTWQNLSIFMQKT